MFDSRGKVPGRKPRIIRIFDLFAHASGFRLNKERFPKNSSSDKSTQEFKIMIRKTLAVALGLMMLTLSANVALAQIPGGASIPPEVLDALKSEPPLSQADVDAYLKIMPDMPKAMSDPSALVKAYEAAGLSEVRFSYIVSKIALAQAMNMGATAEQLNINQLPDVLRPTDADKELVKKNMDALNKAAMEMTQAMGQ
ncbi:hypothetical protein C4J81_07400 [Deltaproteobacteria bacterium Smac51]|nr:hypothetical protein C4J81_07400 [Deltaproteobacteria bacterium Smac51]